jgi:hypothetical protein
MLTWYPWINRADHPVRVKFSLWNLDYENELRRVVKITLLERSGIINRASSTRPNAQRAPYHLDLATQASKTKTRFAHCFEFDEITLHFFVLIE